MKKYRIVEAKMPYISHGETKIRYEYRYDIEYHESLFFGLIKQWNKCGSFNSLKEAMAEIELWKQEETWKVIDVN